MMVMFIMVRVMMVIYDSYSSQWLSSNCHQHEPHLMVMIFMMVRLLMVMFLVAVRVNNHVVLLTINDIKTRESERALQCTLTVLI